MQNETKKFATKVVNGKQVVIGCVWKWGPLLRQVEPKKPNTKPATRN